MGGDADKAKKGTDKGGATATPARPVPPPRAKPALPNSVREARSQQATHARAADVPAPPPPIDIITTTVKVGWDLFFGPDVEVTVTVTPIVLELMGNPTLALPPTIRDVIWPVPYVTVPTPVQFGSLAAGTVGVYKDNRGTLNTEHEVVIPYFHPDLLPLHTGEQFGLAFTIKKGEVKGELVLTKEAGQQRGLLPPIKRITDGNIAEILGVEDLQGVKPTIAENALAFGKCELDVFLDDFLLDGVFQESDKHPSFLQLVDDRKLIFDVWADVEAKGIEKQPIKIERDQNGEIRFEGSVQGKLDPLPGHRLEGKLDATFERGVFDIDGSLKYQFSSGATKPSVDGEIEVRLTDLATARNAIRDRLGKYAPADPSGDTAPNGLALWGEGSVTFVVNDWLQGDADVVVDPDGFITVVGHLEVPKRFQLFEQTSIDKLGIGKVPLDADPINHLAPFEGHKLSLFGPVELTPHGSVGPGFFDDLEAEGVFSTYPKERLPTQFSISGTFSASAEMGLRLDAYIKIFEGGLFGADFTISADATLSARAVATPKIGRGIPPGGSEPTFFFAGDLYVTASLDLTTEVGIDAYVDLVFWKKRVAYKPIKFTFNVGHVGLRVSGSYYFGKGLTVHPKFSIAKLAGGQREYGFNNDVVPDQVLYRQQGKSKSSQSVGSWQAGSYPEAHHFSDLTPESHQPSEPVGTGTLAAGGIEPYESEPETKPAPPPSATPPPTSIASGPGATPVAPPPTPPPQPPTATTPPPPTVTPPSPAPTPPTTTPATPTPAPTPVTPTPPSTTPPGGGAGGPPPPTPPSPPTGGPAPEQPLVETVMMVDTRHTLLLYRLEPVRINIEPPEDRLRYKIDVSERVLQRHLDQARSGVATIRSVQQLEDEIAVLQRLANTVNQVERQVRKRVDPLRPPSHVAGFEMLGDDIEAYAKLFDRTMFFDESFLRGQPSPTPAALPARYQNSQVLRQLERMKPGKVNELIGKYKDVYVPKYNASTRKKRKKMTELEYLEMRGRFMLGTEVEKPIIELYSSLSGITVEKNNFPIYVADANATKDRTRKPDFFDLGKVIGDVKNVKNQGYDQQMEDNFRIADADNVRLGPGLTKKYARTSGVLVAPADETPRFDLIVRVPWHPRGGTEVEGRLASKITGRGKGSDIWELIDDPSAD